MNLSPEQSALIDALGTMPDKTVGEKFGLAAQTVYCVRKAFGISPFRDYRTGRGIEWQPTPDEIERAKQEIRREPEISSRQRKQSILKYEYKKRELCGTGKICATTDSNELAG